MSNRVYQPPYCNNMNMYGESPYPSKTDLNQQQYFQYPSMEMNLYNQSSTALDQYNNQTYSNNKIQNNPTTTTTTTNLYSDHLDWENRIGEVEKIPDKIDLIEISSKDLSPASYCSNLDLFMPDFYKGISKDMNYYNKYDAQWYNNPNISNQKSMDFPSCAQINQNNITVQKTVKYCSIQKPQEFDCIMKNYGCNNNETIYTEQCAYYRNKNNQTEMQDYNTFSYCDKMQSANPYYHQMQNVCNTTTTFPEISLIDQQTECSNDESDIIVEDSDEEIGEFNEFRENKCIVCNMSNTNIGPQFYLLTAENPLTMSSQKPVYFNLLNIIGKSFKKHSYLCSECLGLINTIDHLQFKINNFKAELLAKFTKTCFENKVHFRKCSRNSRKYIPKFRCKRCKKVLSLQKYCEAHLRKHKIAGYLCEICGKLSRNRLQFRMHRKQHAHKKFVKFEPFKCRNCPKLFRTKSNLKEHENFCLGILPFSCKYQYCDKKFASRTKLKNHIKLKHDKKFIAICSICNIGFIKASDYKSHMITHSTEKKFACKKCDKSYKTLSNLNFHMKIHNNKLPFICEICNKGFMRKDYLESHINNHKGVKNYVCNICNKKFVSQKNLDSHLKYHDEIDKAKTCNICGKIIINFEEHLRIHNNLKEFECDQCNMKFNTKGTLAKHKKLKHKIEIK